MDSLILRNFRTYLRSPMHPQTECSLFATWNRKSTLNRCFFVRRIKTFHILVPKVGFEPTRPIGHYALNVARLPFRHFGLVKLL